MTLQAGPLAKPRSSEDIAVAERLMGVSLSVPSGRPLYADGDVVSGLRLTTQRLQIAQRLCEAGEDIRNDEVTRCREIVGGLNRLHLYAFQHDSGEVDFFRPLQGPMFASIVDVFEQGISSTYVKATCAAGKTVVFLKLVEASEWPSLIVVPYNSLVTKTLREIRSKAPNLDVGVVNGETTQFGHRVTITTYNSLVSRLRDGTIDPRNYRLAILDEAHEAMGPKRRAAVEVLKKHMFVCGMTATDTFYSDYKLSGLLGPPACVLNHQDAVDARLNCSSRVAFVHTKTDLTGVKVVGGDYDPRQLSGQIRRAELSKAAVQVYQTYCGGRPALAFCHGVTRAVEMAHDFCAAGIPAAAVVGKIPSQKRDQIFKDLETGKLKILTGDRMLATGNDTVNVSEILNLAMTLSGVKAEQRAGRGMRFNPDDPDKVTTVYEFLPRRWSGGRRPVTYVDVLEGRVELRPKSTWKSGPGTPEKEKVVIESLPVSTGVEEVAAVYRRLLEEDGRGRFLGGKLISYSDQLEVLGDILAARKSLWGDITTSPATCRIVAPILSEHPALSSVSSARRKQLENYFVSDPDRALKICERRGISIVEIAGIIVRERGLRSHPQFRVTNLFKQFEKTRTAVEYLRSRLAPLFEYLARENGSADYAHRLSAVHVGALQAIYSYQEGRADRFERTLMKYIDRELAVIDELMLGDTSPRLLGGKISILEAKENPVADCARSDEIREVRDAILVARANLHSSVRAKPIALDDGSTAKVNSLNKEQLYELVTDGANRGLGVGRDLYEELARRYTPESGEFTFSPEERLQGRFFEAVQAGELLSEEFISLFVALSRSLWPNSERRTFNAIFTPEARKTLDRALGLLHPFVSRYLQCRYFADSAAPQRPSHGEALGEARPYLESHRYRLCSLSVEEMIGFLKTALALEADVRKGQLLVEADTAIVTKLVKWSPERFPRPFGVLWGTGRVQRKKEDALPFFPDNLAIQNVGYGPLVVCDRYEYRTAGFSLFYGVGVDVGPHRSMGRAHTHPAKLGEVSFPLNDVLEAASLVFLENQESKDRVVNAFNGHRIGHALHSLVSGEFGAALALALDANESLLNIRLTNDSPNRIVTGIEAIVREGLLSVTGGMGARGEEMMKEVRRWIESGGVRVNEFGDLLISRVRNNPATEDLRAIARPLLRLDGRAGVLYREWRECVVDYYD